MKANGIIREDMVTVSVSKVMVIVTLVNGVMIHKMAMAFVNMPMETGMTAIGSLAIKLPLAC